MFLKQIFRINALFRGHHRNNSSNTIFALSSGHGKCGVAVIRVSGANAGAALSSLTGLSHPPQPRTALLKSIKNPRTNETLDKGLILWFPGPNSFTGEDCCEFQVHGSIAVVNSVLNALSRLPKLRLAEPGEFTRRAFYNGKLDLTEVEGLADLLQAETEFQRRQAFLQTQGVLSKLYNNWRATLVRSVAHIEAHIDFEETETISEGILGEITVNVGKLRQNIQQHLEDGRKGEMLRNGVKTVILGEPNVGKSSLLNLLCQRPAAIVTPLAGTTRDVLEITLNIGGYPLILSDTAGLRAETSDVIEREGISRALKSYETADLIILVADCAKCLNWLKSNKNETVIDYLRSYVKSLHLNSLLKQNCHNPSTMFAKNCVVVLNKTDLVKDYEMEDLEVTLLSCKHEDGINDLVEVLTNNLKTLCGEPSEEHPSMNQARHRQHLSNCLEFLDLFFKQVDNCAGDTVLMAEYLRRALKSLGHLVGVVTTEQLLDVIFRDFCIGK